MNQLFEILRRHGLISRGRVNGTSLEALDRNRILEIAEELSEVTKMTDRRPKTVALAHCASLSLGGRGEDCQELSCRLARAGELARYAVLYSDRVYVRNYMLDYQHFVNGHPLRRIFHDDVAVLLALKPLIEKGFVELFSPDEHVCPTCMLRRTLGRDAGRRLEAEGRRLRNEFLLNTNVSVESRYGGKVFGVHLQGPQPYYEHGGQVVVSYLPPKALASRPRLLARICEGRSTAVSTSVKRELGHHKWLANNVVTNVSYELAATKAFDASFLTNRELHISFLQSISEDPEISRRNSLASRHLTSAVPFAEDVDISNLIKLREREEEAFILYRQALNESISEFRARTGRFSERDASTLYRDVISPRLASLDRRVRKAKRDLITKPLRSAVALAGLITFGLYSGLTSPQLAQVATSLGIGKIAYDILDSLQSVGDARETVAGDELYFLWRVKRVAKKQ